MSKDQTDDTYSDDEAAERRDDVIKRMLNTPPRPRQAKEKERSDTKGAEGKPKSSS